jgi:N-acetylglucosaminyldiphosphoundecaprenol N-acetyl-beta-D-mannosaminyltransferase
LTILGIPVDSMTQDQAVDWIADAVKAGVPRQIVSVNPERIMRSLHDQELAGVLRRADLSLADGVGVLWAARRQGTPLPNRVSGVDLVRAMAERGARVGWRFFFLGAGPGVAEAAGDVLKRVYPGFQLVGAHAGSPARAEEAAAVALIRQSRADVLIVAYGAPAEELWIARNLASTGVRVAIGVGGALDFISGRARRAPRWMRDHGLEWVHRLGMQPWRWRRMLALPRFVLRVMRTDG